MKYWQKDILILGVIIMIWIFISLVLQNKVCANWKECSPIPTNDIVPSPTPTPSCTPTPQISPILQQTAQIISLTPTGITVTTIPNTPVPGPTTTGTPVAGQSATIALPTQAPDTGRAE